MWVCVGLGGCVGVGGWTCVHTYVRAYVRTYVRACMRACRRVTKLSDTLLRPPACVFLLPHQGARLQHVAILGRLKVNVCTPNLQANHNFPEKSL